MKSPERLLYALVAEHVENAKRRKSKRKLVKIDEGYWD
jgi:hypothetical protein